MKFTLPQSIEDLDSRIKIILENNLFSPNRIYSFYKGAKLNKTNRGAKEVLKIFKSTEHGFDDLYKVKMFTVLVLLDADNFMSNEEAVAVYKTIKESTKDDAGEIFKHERIADEVTKARHTIYSYGIVLKSIIGNEVKNRLALLEMLTFIYPDGLIPELLKVCPLYLECPFVQNKIYTNQHNAKYGTKESAKNSRKFLKDLIYLDGREKTKTNLDMWRIDLFYHNFSKHIGDFRTKKKEKIFNQKEYDSFCKEEGVPSYLKDALISPFSNRSSGPKELTLSFMVDRKMIKHSRSYTDIQSKLSLLKRKHKGTLYIPVVIQMLDVAIKNKNILESHKLWEVFR
ncbi:MAG: hypothetical protein HQK52_09350 [Oligoflexia bacterium]|nr:hypothetical protein [Oligoflexia bacterium]